MNWALLPFRRYAEFGGRSRRMEYWMFTLLNAVIVTILMVVTGGFAAMTDSGGEPGGAVMAMLGGAGLLIGVYALAVLLPSIAVTIRRLHDRDMSGWWYLGAIIGSLIPLVGILVSIAFLVLLALPGTPGPNRFGEDPKGTDLVETVN